MPELPEVARTCQSLNQRLKNKTIIDIKIHSGRYSRHGNPAGMQDFLVNGPMKCEGVNFYGKLLIFEFTNGTEKWWMRNTLGMSGGWKSTPSKHGHVEMIYDDGSVFFTDPRNFGTVAFTNNQKAIEGKIRSIGPNHLAQKISDDLFAERIRRFPESDICAALMNQSLIGGIGNYIKAEVLYRSRISPKRKVKEITDEEFSRLNKATEEVVRGSFSKGGATIHSYSGMDWEEGEYPFFFQVYGRDVCEAGFRVVTETTSDGRTTHWVPEIQI
jgi:formamidopyrimidine-DNA glycosylase